MTTVAPYPPVDGTQPCFAEDPELFFVGTSGNASARLQQLAPEQQYAIQVCGECFFIRPCLAYALTHQVMGIWGGTTDRQRDDLRREHGITAVPVRVDNADVADIDPDLLGVS